jgi:hypothetical protein
MTAGNQAAPEPETVPEKDGEVAAENLGKRILGERVTLKGVESAHKGGGMSIICARDTF